VAILAVKVRPRSRASTLTRQPDGSFVATLRAPPVDGRANAELVGLVAEYLGVPRAAVRIKAGAGGRTKLVEVPG
jgi:uncharacterized protein YggU (UPF0235/DUF167 family)